MENDQSELEDFIKNFLNGVRNSIGDKYCIDDAIEFNIAVIKTKSVKGGLKIFVADAKGKYENEKISTVKFKIRPKNDEILLMGT